jgi:hypothetical protein
VLPAGHQFVHLIVKGEGKKGTKKVFEMPFLQFVFLQEG